MKIHHFCSWTSWSVKEMRMFLKIALGVVQFDAPTSNPYQLSRVSCSIRQIDRSLFAMAVCFIKLVLMNMTNVTNEPMLIHLQAMCIKAISRGYCWSRVKCCRNLDRVHCQLPSTFSTFPIFCFWHQVSSQDYAHGKLIKALWIDTQLDQSLKSTVNERLLKVLIKKIIFASEIYNDAEE